MKNIALFATVLSAAASLSAASITDVAVRQLWPFSRNVEVAFTVSGIESPVQLTVKLKEDGRVLGAVPPVAYRETSAAVDADGQCRLQFDPREVPCLATRGKLKNFSVEFVQEPLAAEDVLYVIFDLTKSPGAAGQRTIVTTEALKAGVWGAWEDAIWTDSKLVPTGKPVWTGVTNDMKYATTHLVMRRIPAGTFPMGYAATADWGKDEPPNISQRNVTITQPYYIGVYAMTKKQVRFLTGSTGTSEPNYPSADNSYDYLRGAYTTAGGPYDWPTDKTVDPDSVIGKLRAATGVDFDLPTEAQWEKAARAGSAGVYYDGTVTTTKSIRNTLAWWSENSGNATHPVGQLKANNYGLYDTLGNVFEWVLDWQAGSVEIALTDPEGPTAAGPAYWSAQGVPKRMVKGGNFTKDAHNIILNLRSQNPTNAGALFYGWRAAMPVAR